MQDILLAVQTNTGYVADMSERAKKWGYLVTCYLVCTPSCPYCDPILRPLPLSQSLPVVSTFPVLDGHFCVPGG